MVKAEKLECTTVMDALERGDFYASTGPQFHDLYIEDGVLKVTCSPVWFLIVSTERRKVFLKRVPKGESFTEAEFDLKPFIADSEALALKNDKKSYIRVTIRDDTGEHAWTRAFFLDEIK